MKKWVRIVGITAFILGLLAFIAAWNILPRIILQPYRADAKQMNATSGIPLNPSFIDDHYIDFDVLTEDGYRLDAWYVHGKNPKATIILVHGIGGVKEANLGTAQWMSENGFNTILFDLRAMGRSEGPYCTYGKLERSDIRQFTDSLLKMEPDIPIGIMGTSLGGAIALQCLGTDDRLKFGVIECTFDDLNHVVRAYTERFFGVQLDWIADFALWRAETVADMSQDDLNPADYASRITSPVFISHGNLDKNIPFQWGHRNFECIPHQRKTFYEVVGADHNNMHSVGGKNYRDALLNFLNESVLTETPH